MAAPRTGRCQECGAPTDWVLCYSCGADAIAEQELADERADEIELDEQFGPEEPLPPRRISPAFIDRHGGPEYA